jgi:hypothetical protein
LPEDSVILGKAREQRVGFTIFRNPGNEPGLANPVRCAACFARQRTEIAQDSVAPLEGVINETVKHAKGREGIRSRSVGNADGRSALVHEALAKNCLSK